MLKMSSNTALKALPLVAWADLRCGQPFSSALGTHKMTELEMEILRYIGSNKPTNFFQIVRRFGHTAEDLPCVVESLSSAGLVCSEQGGESLCLSHKGNLLIGKEK